MENPVLSTAISSLRRRLTNRVTESWSSPEGLPLPRPIRKALELAAPCYLRGLAKDQEISRKRQRSLPACVISVGNLVVGGTGKTPFTLWLAEHLSRRGLRVAVLSRGYGGGAHEAALVPGAGETLPLVKRYGDEPVLMARKLNDVPVWVGRNRYDAGLAAVRISGAQVLILDDGFQHLSLARDLDLVLLDCRSPFGNGEVLPLGPLREPVSHLQRASAVILTRAEDPHRAEAVRRSLRIRFPDKPVFTSSHRLREPVQGLAGPRVPFDKLQQAPAGAFAGIARPQTFFDSLRRAGVRLARSWAFPDHHPYARRDIRSLLESVRRDGLRWLLTTEKDYVRLPSWLQSVTLTVGLEMHFGPDATQLVEIVDAAAAICARGAEKE